MFVTARLDRYDHMCGLYSYNQHKDNSTSATDFHDGWPLPDDLNVIDLIYICVTITYFDAWINTLGKNIAWPCLAYQYKIKEFSKKS